MEPSSLLPTRPLPLSTTSLSSLLSYFESTYALYEQLFHTINDHSAYYLKPEPLRHPLIFYLGHTAVVYVNKLIIAGLLKKRVNPDYETMFAVGVDEMDWDDLSTSHYNWPKVEEVFQYRAKVKEIVIEIITNTPYNLPITWDNPFWIIHMGIEHERIHLETSSVIMRRLDIKYLTPSNVFPPSCEISAARGYEGEIPTFKKNKDFPTNELLQVGKTQVAYNRDYETYGWDNEFGRFEEEVAEFKVAKFLVSNAEFYDFVVDGGYNREEIWTEEGKRWLKSTKSQHPLFWISIDPSKHIYKQRNLFEIIDMPWDWPVETNYLEAKAFCNWKNNRKSLINEDYTKTIRLPIEAEYMALRFKSSEDVTNWRFGSLGNINLEKYSSSCPINMFLSPEAGVYDLVGNVWQHTETEINGFPGFKVHRVYDDFSTPTFDSRHNIIKGGSWISTGNEALKWARYAFRRHFFQHAGFRYVEGGEVKASKAEDKNIYKTDSIESRNLELNYGEETFLNIPNYCLQAANNCLKKFNKSGQIAEKALVVGCGSGRSSYELTKEFKEVVGLDMSARFFHLAVRLKDNGRLNYMVGEEGELSTFKEILLEKYGFNKERVYFSQQQDLCNIDVLKFNDFQLIFVDNVLENVLNPRDLLHSVAKVQRKQGILVIASAYQWKHETTNKSNWLGGFKEVGESKFGLEGISEILRESYEEEGEIEEEMKVERENGRRFVISRVQFSFWRKK